MLDETDPMFADEVVGPDGRLPRAARCRWRTRVRSRQRPDRVPLAERGVRVHGIDICARRARAAARQDAGRHGVTTTLGDYTTTTVDGSFSLVYLVWNGSATSRRRTVRSAAFVERGGAPRAGWQLRRRALRSPASPPAARAELRALRRDAGASRLRRVRRR